MSIIKFILSVLSRKEVSDIEARNNFIEVIWDYIDSIHTTEDLEIQSNKQSYQHKVFYDKLKVLAERFKTIGDEVVPDNKVEDFLIELQNNIREYLYNNVEFELYELRRSHYSKLAFNKSNPQDSPAFKKVKDEMFNSLTSKKNNYSDLGF